MARKIPLVYIPGTVSGGQHPEHGSNGSERESENGLVDRMRRVSDFTNSHTLTRRNPPLYSFVCVYLSNI